jgi:signal transduction histidine kinase
MIDNSNALHWASESKTPAAERPVSLAANNLGSIPVGLAHLIHEITSPLTNLSLTLQLLGRRVAKANENPDPLVLTMLREMAGEVDRMRSLVSSVRSHVHSLWQSDIIFQPLDLRCLINELLESEGARYETLGIRVRADFSLDLPRIQANAELLKQALSNLFKNAVEAMPHGGTLTVRAYPEENLLVLQIVDTGVGIPADLDLFAPFATSKPEGMGLGLTIAQNIVNIHGGKITCMSQPGKGATFRLSFRCAVEAQETGKAQPEDPTLVRLRPAPEGQRSLQEKVT